MAVELPSDRENWHRNSVACRVLRNCYREEQNLKEPKSQVSTSNYSNTLHG